MSNELEINCTVFKLPTETEENCKNIEIGQPEYDQDSDFAPAKFKCRESSLHHHVTVITLCYMWGHQETQNSDVSVRLI
jgi:hypothetical protein